MTKNDAQLERSCSSDDPMKKYFELGVVDRDFVYDAPDELPNDGDQLPLERSCRYFLSAINEGNFNYRINKNSQNECYPSILHKTCSIVDMASKNFIKHCQTLLGSSDEAPTPERPNVNVVPLNMPQTCSGLMAINYEPMQTMADDNVGKSTGSNRRFVAFVREDAVFPVRPRVTTSVDDEAALPPEKCQLSELGWITLLANHFYKISGLVKKNGTQGYLVEVEVQLFREPNNVTVPTTAAPNKVTVITVPEVENSAESGRLHGLAGHGTMRLRNIVGIGTLASIKLQNSRTNCALLRYSGIDRYHLRCRLPYELISQSFGLLVDGCPQSSSESNNAQVKQARNEDPLLQKLLHFDLTLVADNVFELEKESGFPHPKRINPPTGGLSGGAASPAINQQCFIITFVFNVILFFVSSHL